MHRAVAVAAGAQVPPGIGAKRRLHHRHPYAGYVVAVGVNGGDQRGITPGIQDLRGFLADNAAFELFTEIQSATGCCWQRAPRRREWTETPRAIDDSRTSVPSLRSGTRLAGGGSPLLAQASSASSMARNSMDVCTILVKC